MKVKLKWVNWSEFKKTLFQTAKNQYDLIFTAPDPEYGFKKKLELKKHGLTKKQLKLKCKVDNPDARVKWYKDGVPVSRSDPNILIESDDGVQTLTLREARVEDTGKYTCKIEEFGKEGDSETTCDVTIGGKHYS